MTPATVSSAPNTVRDPLLIAGLRSLAVGVFAAFIDAVTNDAIHRQGRLVLPRYVRVAAAGRWVRGSGRWWPGAAGGRHAVECSCGQGCEPAEAGDDAGALEQPAEMDQPG